MIKFTNTEIIEKLRSIYGDKYDYSKVNYVDSRKKITLICPIHGEFEKRLDHLLNGSSCDECRKYEKRKKEFETFLLKAKKIHGDKYDYSKVEYVNADTKVCIICPTHGEFLQTPNNHVNQKQGCNKCYSDSKRGKYKMTLNEFIEKARKIHGDKYDYTRSIYKGIKNKINITCPIHGEFNQVAYDHLRGFGCEYCKYDNNTYTKEQFVERARQIHGDKYDYSKVKYKNNHTKVCIICPIHGEFQQTPLDHLIGSGCQQCNMSHLERMVLEILKNNKIEYIMQYRAKWLKRLSLDFYLPQYHIAIECQGMQHFKAVEYFGGEATFKRQIERDKRKRQLCEKNDVKLLYFTNIEELKDNNCITTLNTLLEEIKKA